MGEQSCSVSFSCFSSIPSLFTKYTNKRTIHHMYRFAFISTLSITGCGTYVATCGAT